MKRLAENMTILITICLIGGLVGCAPDCPKGQQVTIKLTDEKAMLIGYGLGGDCIVRLGTLERKALDPFEYEIAN